MHASDSTVRWCGGLCLPLHSLQCAFYLHVVSLGRKLHTPFACVCNFLRNEGMCMLYHHRGVSCRKPALFVILHPWCELP